MKRNSKFAKCNKKTIDANLKALIGVIAFCPVVQYRQILVSWCTRISGIASFTKLMIRTHHFLSSQQLVSLKVQEVGATVAIFGVSSFVVRIIKSFTLKLNRKKKALWDELDNGSYLRSNVLK